jgi:8-oxo-dGTP diphosphatase
MKKIEVVAGVIFWKDQVLCVQRPKNKLHYISEKFEFNDEWFDETESFFNSKNHNFREVESELKSTMGEDNQPCLHFCPGAYIGLSNWEFHQYDDDYYEP